MIGLLITIGLGWLAAGFGCGLYLGRFLREPTL